MTNRTVKVTLDAAVSGGIAKIKAFQGALSDMGSEADKMALKSKDKFSALTGTLGGVGLALSGAFALAVKSSMDFDKEMSAVGSVVGATKDQMSSLRTAAIQAGAATAYSASDAAKAEEELAKAGISVKDILGGGLQGALSLAAAGQMDLADAATISAQAMNVWKLSGSAVPHIADVLAASANTSAADMSDLGLAIKQGGLVASQFGLTLEDTVGTLSAFADRALVGSDAGTSLKTMLVQLANPSQQSAALMKQLGISAYDTTGKFVGIANLAGQLHDKLSTLTQAQRDQALGLIFGTDAMRAANVLYTQGASGIQKYIDQVNQSGAASKTAAEKMNNLAGDLEQLKGSLETVAIQSGSGANAGLRSLAQAATGAVNAFGQLPAPVQQSITVIAGIGGAGLLAATGFLKARQTGMEFMQTLRDMGPNGEKAATTLGKIGSVAGKIGVVGAVVGILVEGITALGDWLDKKSAPQAHNLDDFTASLKRFADTGKTSGDFARTFGDDLGKLAEDVDKISAANKKLAEFEATAKKLDGPGGRDIRGMPLPGNDVRFAAQAKQDISDLDKALSQLAVNGGAVQAKIAFDKITASLQAQGMTVDQITALFPEYGKAASDAAVNSSGLAQGFGDVTANNILMNQSMQEAIDKGMSLADVWKQLHGAALDFLTGDIAVKQDLQDLADKFIKGKNAIDDNSQAGRDNLKMVAQVINDAQQAAQFKLQETGSVQQATDTYNQYIEKLRATLLQMGLTKDEVNRLIDAYAKLPPAVSTVVGAPGLDTTKNKLLSYKQILDDLNGKVITTYVTQDIQTGQTTTHRSTQKFNRWGGLYQHAAVGALRDASVFSAVSSGARYAFAEPSTRGEAFIPRSGDLARSRGIADYVVGNWLGGQVMWPGQAAAGGGRTTMVNITVTAGMGTDGRAVGQQIADALRPWLNSNGGNVQRALVGRAVP